MANPTWFNEQEYLASKLKQVQASGNTTYADTAALRTAIEAAGFTLFDHFTAYGAVELTSPNALFNATEYLEAKVKALNAPGGRVWTLAEVEKAFADQNITPWQHYQGWGASEGLNPSNAFDTNAYFNAKVNLLNSTQTEKVWTVADVKEAFAAGGFSPISHYLAYGATEGLTVTPVPAAQQVTPDARDIGKTFTLTTVAGEVVNGTADNDTFIATQATYQTGDVVIGNGGIDTLNLSLTGTQAGNATVVGVEKINVTTKSFADVSFNATGVTGAGTVITLANSQAGGTTNGGINNVASGATVVAGAGVTNNLSVALAVDAAGVQIEGGNATGIQVFEVTDKGVSVKAGTTTTGITLNGVLAAGTTTDKATISAVGTVALNNAGAGYTAVENLTLSGNGAAVTYNLDPANTLETVALTGDQNVTLNASALALGGKAVTDTTTGASTTKVIVSGVYTAHNLDKVTADQIQLVSAGAGATTFNLANNANVVIGLDAAGTVAVNSTNAGNLILDSVKSGNVDTAETLTIRVGSSQTGVGNLDVKDFETVNLTIDDGKAAKNDITIANLVASAASNGVVNVSGGDNLVLTAATAKKLDASNLTGKLTATLTSVLADIKGGSGDDVISIGTDGNFKVDGGAGVNTLKITATNDYSDNTVSFANIGLLDLTSAVAGPVAVTFNSSVLDGKAFALKGTAVLPAAIDTLIVKMDTASVDLSGIAVDSATANVTVETQNIATTIKGSLGADTVNHTGSTSLTFTSTAGNDVITGGAAADTITTGAGADVVRGGAGNDLITVGAGSDYVVGGAGADTINLTETVSAIDYVIFAALTDGSAAGAAAGTFTGYDVITGFKSGTDKLVFDSANVVTAPTAVVAGLIDGAKFVKTGDAATDAAKDLTFSDIANVDKVIAYLNDAGVGYTASASASDLIAVTFGDKTAMYAVTNDTAAAVVATEIKLLGTVDSLLVTGDLLV